MNVLITIIDGNPFKTKKAGEMRAHYFIKCLLAGGHDVHVVMPHDNLTSADFNKFERKIQVYFYKPLNFFGFKAWIFNDFNPSYIRAVRRVFRANSIDLTFTISLYGFFTPWLFSRSYVVWRVKEIFVALRSNL
ncbi:MAG: hypothetical protein ACTSRA_22265 [Promethearchaeota archaeon]